MSITIVGSIKQCFFYYYYWFGRIVSFENCFRKIIGKHGSINVKTKSIKTVRESARF